MLFEPADINIDNPSSLYKYYTPTEYNLSSLTGQLFWFSAPTSFNDPLDCHFDLDTYLAAPIEEKIVWSEVLQAYFRPYETDDYEFHREGFRTPQELVFVVDHFLWRLSQAIKGAGVFCLSATPFEVLMWSHYADKHKGFCLEFERTPDNQLGKDACNPVQYTDTPQILRFGEGIEAKSINSAKDPSMIALHSKTCSWAYEKEWRVVYLPRPGGTGFDGLHRISAKLLSITFGMKVNKSTIETVTNIMKDQHDCEFYLMDVVPRTLMLRPRRIKI